MNQQTIDYAEYEVLKKEHEQLINAILAYNKYLEQAKKHALAKAHKTYAEANLAKITGNHGITAETLADQAEAAYDFANAYDYVKRLLQKIIDAFQLDDSNGES